MISKMIMLLVIAALGWYAYTTGAYYSLTHGMQAEPKRACELCGPYRKGAFMAYEKDDADFILQTHIGTPGDKLSSCNTLDAIVSEGRVALLPEHTQAVVETSGTRTLYGCIYPITKVKITNGEYQDQEGWVERENVIDNPIQQIYQAMRSTSAPTKRLGGSADPSGMTGAYNAGN